MHPPNVLLTALVARSKVRSPSYTRKLTEIADNTTSEQVSKGKAEWPENSVGSVGTVRLLVGVTRLESPSRRRAALPVIQCYCIVVSEHPLGPSCLWVDTLHRPRRCRLRT
jgi:hypothetical protein